MKKEKNSEKVLYFSDPLNDDFAGTNIKNKPITSKFKYVHKNLIWRFFSFLIYYLFAIPVLWVYMKVFLRVKFKNKKALKKLKGKNYFKYGNHSGVIDAFSPILLSYPKRDKIVVNSDAVSLKGMKNIVQMLGGLPIPTDLACMKHFVEALNFYYKKGYTITIYPEAHIWPYYTGVREFKDSSFGYPVSLNSPVIAFFTAYTEPKGLFSSFRKANVTIYISDPIYPDQTKPKKVAQKELRDKVYAFMKECSEKYSTYNHITYKHISEKPKTEYD